MDDAQLRTVWLQRQHRDRSAHLSQPLNSLMKYTLGRLVRQLQDLATVWDDVIPAPIRDHTALQSLNKGVLTVVVDSAPHRFQLQGLLSGGLMRDIQGRFSGALNKIRIIPGQFCSVDISGRRRYEF